MDIDDAAVEIHQTAVEHGFWPAGGRNFGEMLMLVASELAEALEEDREGRPSVYFMCPTCGAARAPACERMDGKHYIPVPPDSLVRRVLTYFGWRGVANIPCEYNGPWKPEGALVEIADAIIRLLDTGQAEASKTHYTVSEVMRIKMDYNHTRKHMHGKAY
jgi:hypothetical protein